MRRLLPIAFVLAVTVATTVEEVVAVVGSTPILASDVALARMVGLVEPDPDEDESHLASRVLEARIRLELQYRHLEETGVLYRLSLDPRITAERLALRLGPAAEERLRRAGLDHDDLDELAVRLAATAAYVDQRLRPRIQVSATELEAEHRRLLGDQLSRGTAPPLPEVEEQVRLLLTERKLNAEIERWLEQAQERVEVTRFVP